MSTQVPQQPVVVYPNTVSGQAPPSHHSHSDGSFGTVFIVLAVIIVISAIACFLGRLCNRRMSSQTKPSYKSKQKPNPNQSSRHKERDIEFGFEGRAAKPAGPHGDDQFGKGFHMPGAGNDDQLGKGFHMPGAGNDDQFGKGFMNMPGAGNGDPRAFRIPSQRQHGHGDIPAAAAAAGIRMPGNGIPAAFRMPGNGHGHGYGDMKPETKHDNGDQLKADA